MIILKCIALERRFHGIFAQKYTSATSAIFTRTQITYLLCELNSKSTCQASCFAFTKNCNLIKLTHFTLNQNISFRWF